MASSAPIGSNVPARKARRTRRPAFFPRPPAPGGIHKELGWVGVRERLWGGYAAEIRVPSSRYRVWIGRFQHALQAALAYDAAMFCFYGDNLPKLRKYNFPELPRPEIPDYGRYAGLTVDNIKEIADKHARDFAPFVPLPPVIPAPAAPVQVAEAGGGAAAAGEGVAAAAGTGATDTVDGHGNDDEVYIDADILTGDDLQFPSNDPDDFIRLMDVDVDVIFRATSTTDCHGNDVVYIDAEILTSEDLQFSSNNPDGFIGLIDVDMDLIFSEI
ncbi:hypothetical protein BAE44_0008879 [Dichanthelium oligosanthes]|uniref:AP2/ERF domain-containing protein n=1 Tax=Dichanthelium oligosanthes TaxID=888268 RepID=A0A1E5VYC8_9POAL|nr:hypothetical protein BAE44_0008879 [Dichanthelium oligosanthes]